jgi:hypothetical protein
MKGAAMETGDGAGGAEKPAVRRPGKPAKATAGKGDGRKKMTLILAADTAERITVHAHRMGMTKAALVDKLVSEHLRRYVVSDREKKGETGPAATAA